MTKMKNGQGKIKKAERRAKKEGLRPHYVMVQRVPTEKGLRAYTKLVTIDKAAVLIYGRRVYGGAIEKLSREFKAVA